MVSVMVERETHSTDRFIPVNRNTSAVDVGGASVLKVFQSGVAGLLSIAGLETEVEETTNTVLSSGRRVVHDKAEAVSCQ